MTRGFRIFSIVLTTVAACACAFAQKPAEPPAVAAENLTFDAASINLAPPPTQGRMFMGMQGGPGTRDPGTYRCNNCNLLMLILQAYDIKNYQLTRPNWIDGGDRYNITAKVPPGTTKEQFRVMMQNLLAERFKLAVHREKKDMQVYEMVVAKGGPKFKETVEDPKKDDADDSLPPLPPPGGRGRGPNVDKDGFPQIPSGCKGCIMVVPGGKARLAAAGETMKEFAGMMSNQMGKPVIDATGLTGKYDLSITFQMGAMMGRGVMLKSGGGPPPPPPPSSGSGPLDGSDDDTGVPIVGAIQSQLGLKLEPKKGSVDIIVVDRAEKTPTEN